MIVDVTEGLVPRVKAFLDQYPETSLFLLSTLRAYGPRLGPSLYSGDFKAITEHDEIRAVFAVTRGGSLVAQAAGHAELAGEIVRVCLEQPIGIRGVLGEWRAAEAIWSHVCAGARLTPTFASKEVLYRLLLKASASGANGLRIENVRMLTPADHAQWEAVSSAFLREQGLPVQGEPSQREAAFVRSAGLGHWWGAFDGDQLQSLAGLIAVDGTIAQVGGVFTPPAWRGRGLARSVMAVILRDSATTHALERLFLFTGEQNRAARRLYESLGFERIGHFGLFYGE